jgi:hypothetical protein
LSAPNLEAELEAARKLKEILDKEAGIKEGSSILGEMSGVVQNNLLILPRRVLDGIYEKLEILKTAGLDVERQMTIHNQHVEALRVAVNQIQEQGKPEAPLDVEGILNTLRQFFYLLALVDYLKGEVDSMCQNHITMMRKFVI